MSATKMPPCYDCSDRAAGCHSTCEKYIEWRKNRPQNARPKSDNILCGYISDKARMFEKWGKK